MSPGRLSTWNFRKRMQERHLFGFNLFPLRALGLPPFNPLAGKKFFRNDHVAPRLSLPHHPNDVFPALCKNRGKSKLVSV